jgi:hypothetical protein
LVRGGPRYWRGGRGVATADREGVFADALEQVLEIDGDNWEQKAENLETLLRPHMRGRTRQCRCGFEEAAGGLGVLAARASGLLRLVRDGLRGLV